MDFIRLHVLPPSSGTKETARLVIASPATRIVRSISASPWEVFLRPQDATRFAIHYHAPRRKTNRGE
ncbi:MAG: hypothetical protein OXT65_05715 [Alphaproteobacteria bacterium]|nr:hypothetical protein [Alphaproteobacteria bacterium]